MRFYLGVEGAPDLLARSLVRGLVGQQAVDLRHEDDGRLLLLGVEGALVRLRRAVVPGFGFRD